LAFGIGASGEAIYLGLSNAFIVIFYNQVIGLNNALIGIAIMLAMIGDAISDPLVGIVSDRWRSRLGRRHPFLIAAPVPLALSLYCVFNPPDWLLDLSSDTAIFIWLSVWTIVSRTVLTLFNVPHLALGGELSKDQHERSQLFSANTIFGAVSGSRIRLRRLELLFRRRGHASVRRCVGAGPLGRRVLWATYPYSLRAHHHYHLDLCCGYR
jgi:Na+/melibiose symporter-like transporter